VSSRAAAEAAHEPLQIDHLSRIRARFHDNACGRTKSGGALVGSTSHLSSIRACAAAERTHWPDAIMARRNMNLQIHAKFLAPKWQYVLRWQADTNVADRTHTYISSHVAHTWHLWWQKLRCSRSAGVRQSTVSLTRQDVSCGYINYSNSSWRRFCFILT